MIINYKKIRRFPSTTRRYFPSAYSLPFFFCFTLASPLCCLYSSGD